MAKLFDILSKWQLPLSHFQCVIHCKLHRVRSVFSNIYLFRNSLICIRRRVNYLFSTPCEWSKFYNRMIVSNFRFIAWFRELVHGWNKGRKIRVHPVERATPRWRRNGDGEWLEKMEASVLLPVLLSFCKFPFIRRYASKWKGNSSGKDCVPWRNDGCLQSGTRLECNKY